MSKYKSLNTKAWCCVFHSKVWKMFRSLPKEKQAEILKNIFNERKKTMTREEAIYVLRREIEPIEGEWHPFEEVEEAIRMAIEALSAEAVHIETYRELYEKYVELKHASAETVHKPDYSYEADMVRRLRQAEAVQGEWILDGGTPICSVCHKEPCWSSEGYDFTDYCPNCGARMKGGAE